MTTTLNLTEAAALLRMHPQTVLRLCRAGLIPAAKPGRRWVFVEADLIEWLRSQYAKPVAPPPEPIRSRHSTDLPRTSTNQKYAQLLGLNSARKSVRKRGK